MNTKTEILQSATWHTSIETLPLRTFIDILIDKKLELLVITGQPTPEDLATAWQEIREDFADSMGGYEQTIYLQKLKEMSVLELKLTRINVLLDLLKELYYEPFAIHLNAELSTSLTLDPDKPKEYRRNLTILENRSRAYKIDINLLRIELETFQANVNEDHGPAEDFSRGYFQKILITLSDHAKFPITDLVTVFEFTERMKRWNSYCEQTQKSISNG